MKTGIAAALALAAASQALAQGSVFQSPPALEEQGGLASAFFEQPILVAGALVVLGALAFVLLNRREKGRLGLLAFAGFLIAALAAGAAGFLVETPREHLRAQTRALVDATGRADAAAVGDILDDRVDLLMGGQSVSGVGRAVILTTLATLEGRYALDEARVLTLQASVDSPTRARTQVQVRAAASGGPPSLSWWMLNWSKDAAGQWRATRIDCLLMNGQRPSPAWMP